jgi:hypothetical protein
MDTTNTSSETAQARLRRGAGASDCSRSQCAEILSAKTQRAPILRLLIDGRGGWVRLTEILELRISQFGARIFELRRTGFHIENKTERDDSGVVRSWYRFVNDTPKVEFPKSDPPMPAPEWRDRPRLTGLPLFDAAVCR